MNHESLVKKYLGMTNYHNEKIPLPPRKLQSVLLIYIATVVVKTLITEKNTALRRQRYPRLRTVRRRSKSWKKLGRASLWWDRLFNGEIDESEWKLNLRLSKKIYGLVHILRPQLAPKPRSFRPDSNATEKKFGMTLHYLKDQGSLRVTANALEWHRAPHPLLLMFTRFAAS